MLMNYLSNSNIINYFLGTTINFTHDPAKETSKIDHNIINKLLKYIAYLTSLQTLNF